MGANMSGFETPHGFIHTKTPTQLMELQSKYQWRSHFEACKQSDKLMVIYFTAEWCGPCKLFEPYVKELAAKYADIRFFKIDVEKISEAVREFELVDVMPTCILAKGGIEIDRVVGAKKEELQNKIQKHSI